MMEGSYERVLGSTEDQLVGIIAKTRLVATVVFFRKSDNATR